MGQDHCSGRFPSVLYRLDLLEVTFVLTFLSLYADDHGSHIYYLCLIGLPSPPFLCEYFFVMEQVLTNYYNKML